MPIFTVLEGGAGSSWSVSDMLTDAGTVITTVSGWVVANPVLTTCLGLGVVVPTGIYAFKKLIKATKHN